MESNLSRMKKAFIILAVATALVFGYVAYAISENQPEPKRGIAEPGLYYRANVLTTAPHSYWNLTDPDRYVLEAIENPGVWVKANQMDTTFHEQVVLRGWSNTVLYNGQFYLINTLFVDFWHDEEPTDTLIGPSIGIAGVSASWIALGTVAVLKRRKPASQAG